MEAWGKWRVLPWWQLSAGLNLLHKDLHLKPGYANIAKGQSEGFDPGYQWSARSSMDLPYHLQLDFGMRGVGQLTNAPINAYMEGDAQIAWHVDEKLEISLSAYNLFSPDHAETVTPGSPIFLARRSIYLGLRRTF